MTREEIIALAKQHGASAYTNRHYQEETYMTFSPEKLEAFFHAAQQAEREACAKVCERIDTDAFGGERPAPNDCATAIRNRGIQRGINKMLADPVKHGLDLGEKQ